MIKVRVPTPDSCDLVCGDARRLICRIRLESSAMTDCTGIPSDIGWAHCVVEAFHLIPHFGFFRSRDYQKRKLVSSSNRLPKTNTSQHSKATKGMLSCCRLLGLVARD